jgi:Sec-independent protein secretion pathway component TatC
MYNAQMSGPPPLRLMKTALRTMWTAAVMFVLTVVGFIISPTLGIIFLIATIAPAIAGFVLGLVFARQARKWKKQVEAQAVARTPEGR